MMPHELRHILEKGESLTLEFKQRFSTHKKIAKEIIAFANTKGGLILFGVDDDGSIYGVESEKHETELIQESANNYCEPPIPIYFEYIEIDGREIIVCRVEESKIKPHRIQDYKLRIDINESQVYVRVNDKCLLASKEMIKLLQSNTKSQKLKKYSIGKNEKLVFDYLKENESISVNQLSRFINISKRRASRTLINMVRANILIIHKKENGEEYFTSST